MPRTSPSTASSSSGAPRPVRAALGVALLLATACSPEPGRVFVPGPTFGQSIHLSTAQGEHARVRVGEALRLHAERRSGPWIEVPRASLPPGACWQVSPPPDLEPEVAGNLRWLVEPPDAARFNLGLLRDQSREVRFSAPGRYQLSARSAVWCTEPYGGNTLTVEVVAE